MTSEEKVELLKHQIHEMRQDIDNYLDNIEELENQISELKEENKTLKRIVKHNNKISKYLSDIGIKELDLPWNWEPDDPREEFWKQQREEYGFDERDTWSLSYTLALLIYPRLKMYNECNCIDTSFHEFEFKGKKYTQQECMDTILEGLELYLIKEGLDLSDDDYKKIEDSMTLLGLIWWSLWW